MIQIKVCVTVIVSRALMKKEMREGRCEGMGGRDANQGKIRRADCRARGNVISSISFFFPWSESTTIQNSTFLGFKGVKDPHPVLSAILTGPVARVGRLAA